MSNNNNPTVKEHYIPQFYFREFSNNGKQIWEYNLQQKWGCSKLAPINSICYENNLYEFKNEGGDILLQNLIENNLSALEGEISQAISSIKRKVHIKDNHNKNCFLTNYEQVRLVVFACLNIMRSPRMLKLARDLIVEYSSDGTVTNAVNNFAILSCLPIVKDLPEQEKYPLYRIAAWFEDMTFQVGITDKKCIITSDNPVYIDADEPDTTGFRPLNAVIFPLGADMVLMMSQRKKTPLSARNIAFAMNPQMADDCNATTISQAQSWIYSYNKLNSAEIEKLKEVLKRR